MRLFKTILPLVFFILLSLSSSIRIDSGLNAFVDESLNNDRICDIRRYCSKSHYSILKRIKGQISKIRKRHNGSINVLNTVDMLLRFKLSQLRLNLNNTIYISQDLKRLSKGLDTLLSSNQNLSELFVTEVTIPSDMKSEGEIITFASEELSSQISNSNIPSANRFFDPDLKKFLKTGSFVFLMLSTTADVCVLTSMTPCIILYAVGSGGLVVWFAQILRETFGVEHVLFYNTVAGE